MSVKGLKQWFWIGLFCLSVGVSTAGEAISLQALYQQSLMYYPSEKNAILDQRIAERSIDTAKAQWLPSLDVNITGVDSDNDDNDYREAKASIRQELYNRSAFYQVDEAREGLKATRWRSVEQRQSLLIEIASIYTQALIQSEQAELAEQSLQESQTLHRIAQKAVELDQKPLLDLLRAQADVSEKQADLIEARNLEEDALTQLKRYVPVQTLVVDLLPFKAADFASAFIDADGTNQHPSLVRLEYEKRQAEQTMERARSAYYPSANVLWEVRERHTHSRVISKDTAVSESRITLSVDWNLFKGMSTSYAVDSAQYQIGKKINEHQLNKLNLAKEASKTNALIDSTQQSLKALEQVLSARLKAVETVEKSWELNLVDVAEVQSEYSSLQQARLDYYTQQRNLDLEQLRLLTLTGHLNLETP